MPPAKRKAASRDAAPDLSAPAAPVQPQELGLLRSMRNMWQFANLYQWIYIFGKVVKIDDSIDMDVLEAECLKPSSPILVDIGLALLKFVSSHRGLTPELFDEYTRRQYVAKKPERNPFGIDATPVKFHSFDIFTKIGVLQQLTQWVMLHPERIREKMDEQKLTDQTDWRIEPYGWDSDDRAYYLLDDDRLYRMTDAPSPAPEWKPKKNSKKAKAASRAAKRRRTSRSTAANADASDDDEPASESEKKPEPEDDGLGGAKWECIAVTLEEVQAFLHTIRKTRDDNEKVLRNRIEEGLVPILEKHEESRKRKVQARERELLNLEKMAHAKRSSRLAGKADQQRAEEQQRADEERRRAEATAAKKEEQKRLKMEKERDNRLMSRENRLREREARRLQHEEDLAQLSEDSKKTGADGARLSERRLQAEIDRKKQALEELEQEDDDWFFDCVCGVHGQVDDGTHSIACEECGVWMHSKCVGVGEEEADRDDFNFICTGCKRKAANPKPTFIKLKLKKSGDVSLPPTAKSADAAPQPAQPASQQSSFTIEIPSKALDGPLHPESTPPRDGTKPALNGSQLQPSSSQPPIQPNIPMKPSHQAPTLPPPSPFSNGDGPNPFASPHPTLSPPQQSPNKSRAYSTINHSSPSSGTENLEHRSLPPKGVFHISPKVNGAAPQQPHTSPSGLSRNVDAAAPAGAARTDSPLKQPLENASSTLPVLSPPSVSLPTPSQQAHDTSTRAEVSTPQFKRTDARPESSASTLPPIQNGLSPSKRSSPPAQHAGHPTPTAAIYPPVEALSPSPSQQINTPPIKPSDPARPVSQQSNLGSG